MDKKNRIIQIQLDRAGSTRPRVALPAAARARRSPGCRTERSSPGRRGSLSGRRAELSRPAPVLTAVDRRAGACTTVGSSRSFSSIRRRAAALCSCRKKEKGAGRLLARTTAYRHTAAHSTQGWRRPVGWAAALWVETLPQVSERRRRRAAGSAPQPYRTCPNPPRAQPQ